MVKKKTTIHIRLSEIQSHELDKLKKQIGLSKSNIVRMALFQFIKENLEL
jgi:predicted DNA-binding protein